METIKCRACEADQLGSVIDLGTMPLANSLLPTLECGSCEPQYPLHVLRCERCSLVQVESTVDPALIFSDYVYFSSYSDTLLEHARRLAESLIETRGLGRKSLVLEIGSNDGYLLRHFSAAGIPVLGVDPASNIVLRATERGIPTRLGFFGAKLAAGLCGDGIKADVILALNVMAHMPDLNSTIAGIKALLKPKGVFVMESPYVRDLVESLEFDTIYHEHVFYYSLTALQTAFRRHGLEIIGVECLPIHGGSLRLTVAHQGEHDRAISVDSLLLEEAKWGVNNAQPYADFARAVESVKADLCSMLTDLKRRGCRLAGYGASAKGSTLLNYCGIGSETLDFIVDRSPVKQGKFTPGSHLPILSPEVLHAARPDFLLLLTWNFAAEIMAQQEEFLRGGGRFIVPVPRPRIVGAEKGLMST